MTGPQESAGATDLVAVCEHCVQPVPDGGGVLEVDTARADRLLRAWRRRSGDNPLAVFATSPGARPAPWLTRHHACGAKPTFAYQIAVERIRTWPALLAWGVQLSDKPWWPATDWHDLVQRALEPRQAAVSGLLPRLPRDLRGGPVGDWPTTT